MKVIYDFGANEGVNLPYYLKKADKVVAVEANPVLAKYIRDRFASEVGQGRLIVENVVLSDRSSPDVAFYVHKHKPVLSQFPRPADVEHFEVIHLRGRKASEIIAEHGEPHYVKVDLEHFDTVALRDLFAEGIRPPYISAECLDASSFATLVSLGGYNAFKIVDGESVARRYKDHVIRLAHGAEHYSFPEDSAGPFGDDIPGPWMSANRAFHVLAYAGLGWKDIHASNVHTVDEPRWVTQQSFTTPLNIPLRIMLKALPRSLGAAMRRLL